MSKLTSTEKTSITRDWQQALPFYQKYKPLHLVKRNGPVLTGIYLSPIYGGEHYCPVFHVHSLLNPFPVVSVSAGTDMLTTKGVRESISPSRHAKDFQSLLANFLSQAPLAGQGSLSVAEVRALYEKAVSAAREDTEALAQDEALLEAWCRDASAELSSMVAAELAKFKLSSLNDFGLTC